MKTFSLEASNEEILTAVREWAGLLSQQRYQEASAFLWNAQIWSTEFIASIVQEYGKVTPLVDAAVDQWTPRHEVDRFDSMPYVGSVWFDLPFDGYWSNVTGMLDIRIVDSHLVLELEDIHML